MARPRVHDDTTREAILRAAGALLGNEGPVALTTRRLAKEVGASTTAIYSLFGSKEEVVRAMYREGFAGLAAHLAEVDEADPVARVRELGFAYRRAAMSAPHLYNVMFSCPVPEFQPTAEDQARALATLITLRDAVVAATEAGRLSGEPDTITVALWSVVHGLTSLELAGSLDVETAADGVWAVTIDAVLRGLGN